MKDRIPDQAEKLRQLAAVQDAASDGGSATAVLEPIVEAPVIEAPPVVAPKVALEKKEAAVKPSALAPSPKVEAKSAPEEKPLAPASSKPETKVVDTNQAVEAKLENTASVASPVADKPKDAAPKETLSKPKLSKKQKRERQQEKEASKPVVVNAAPAPAVSADDMIGPPAPPEAIARPKPQPTLRIDPSKRFPMQSKTRVIAITGGKGGVGKSNMTCNLAIAMQRMKKRVIVMDADLSLANIDVLLGLTPRHNLSHVLSGQKTIQEIMVQGPEGLGVIPGGSGVEELSQLSEEQIGRLFDAFASLTPEPDVFLIDTAAGIHPNVLQFLLAADQTIVVTTPEPPAYTDAYALIKTLRRHCSDSELGVVVNMAGDSREANDVARLMSQICTQMLGSSFNNLGYIPRDPEVLKAVRRQTPFLLRSPNCPASRAVTNLAASLLQIESRDKGERGLRRFFSRLFKRPEPPQKVVAAS
ncbi:MAG: P-loop NTPase [Candidatus Hinthialibacter antarcticus]|nr:P-loop NTPase [Candidatus Hinthialibacter antarcticus]